MVTLDRVSVSRHLSLSPSPKIPLLKVWFPWRLPGDRLERVKKGSLDVAQVTFNSQSSCLYFLSSGNICIIKLGLPWGGG